MLSDGIFAVAMTLLVLDLRVPVLPPDVTSAALFNALLQLWPKFGALLSASFFLVQNWYIHRRVFHSISKVNYRVSYLNIILLMINCVLPFTTSLVSEHPTVRIAAAVYISNMIMTPLAIYSMLLEARKGGWLKADLSPDFMKWFRKRHAFIVGAYLVAFPIAYVSAEVSVFWICVIKCSRPCRRSYVNGKSTEAEARRWRTQTRTGLKRRRAGMDSFEAGQPRRWSLSRRKRRKDLRGTARRRKSAAYPRPANSQGGE